VVPVAVCLCEDYEQLFPRKTQRPGGKVDANSDALDVHVHRLCSARSFVGRSSAMNAVRAAI